MQSTDQLYAECLSELTAYIAQGTGGKAQPVSTTVDYLSHEAFDLSTVTYTPGIDRTTRSMVFAHVLASTPDRSLLRVTAIFQRAA